MNDFRPLKTPCTFYSFTNWRVFGVRLTIMSVKIKFYLDFTRLYIIIIISPSHNYFRGDVIIKYYFTTTMAFGWGNIFGLCKLLERQTTRNTRLIKSHSRDKLMTGFLIDTILRTSRSFVQRSFNMYSLKNSRRMMKSFNWKKNTQFKRLYVWMDW